MKGYGGVFVLYCDLFYGNLYVLVIGVVRCGVRVFGVVVWVVFDG